VKKGSNRGRATRGKSEKISLIQIGPMIAICADEGGLDMSKALGGGGKETENLRGDLNRGV